MSMRRYFVMVAAALVTAGVPRARAADYVWNNAAGTVWNAAGNWNPNGVPKAAGDTATINGAPTGTSITLNDIDVTLDTFSINSKNTFIQFVDKTVTVDGAFANFVNARALLNNMTWKGKAALTNSIPLSDGVLTIQGDTTIGAAFSNTGAMQVSGSNTGNAPLDSNLKIGSFENKGRLRLNSNVGIGDASITLDGGNGTLTNSNLMEVEVGTGGARSMEGTLINAKNATLNIATSFTALGNANAVHVNNGTISITGKTAVFKVFGKGFTNEVGATIKGIGKFDRGNIPAGGFTNRGSIDPGLSPGTLTIEGDYQEEATAQLDIELAGTLVDAQYDQLVIDGSALLAGSLNPTLLNGFTPSFGDTFVVLDAKNGLSGHYLNASADGSLINVGGGTMQVHYVFGQGVGNEAFVVLNDFLAAAPIPEPTSVLLTLPAVALLLRRGARRGR